ncbi:MAG: HPr kinase/phosphorylase [Caulobacterales bacterium]
MILHAGLIARRLAGRWRGILIEGPSGAGKSDLALRALEAGFRLVSDDRTVVWSSGGALYGRAPPALAGLIEARGHGVTAEPSIGMAQIVLVAACETDPAAIERLPDVEQMTISGVSVRRVHVNAFEDSAPAKLRRAMEHLGAATQQAYQACPLGGSRPRRDRG